MPSVEFDQQWNIDIRASIVEEFGMKPNCWGSTTLNKVGLTSLSIITLSAIFDKVEVREIGRNSCCRSWTIGTFGRGTTLANFQIWGTLQVSKDAFIISVIGEARTSQKFFKTQF